VRDQEPEMRVARYYGWDDVRLENMKVPEIGPGEVLVQVQACGLCGSDLMRWYVDSKAPAVLGHEPVGFVSRVGSGVTGFTPGDRVFVHHHVPCFVCHYCRRGNYSCCETFKENGLHPGGFAEYVRVAARNVEFDVLPLPEGLPFEEATLVEPIACAIRGVERAGVKPGDTVLIVGAGVSGLLFTQLSRLWGAALVVVSDLVEYRLERALDYGAHATINPAVDDVQEEVQRLVGRPGADVVIVTVGNPSVMEQGLRLAAKGGTVLVYAPLPPEDTLPVDVCDLLFSEKTLVTTYSCAPDETRTALDLIRKGSVLTSGLVTHRFGLGQVGEAMRLAAEARDSLKVVVLP
jgi:L-iditol 2-dehydrogenase